MVRGESLSLGETMKLEDGSQITAHSIEQKPKKVKGVSRHEAIHATIALVVGRNVRRVSRVPGPGYEGITELDEFDAAVAMGPHVAGEEGTGWDTHLARLHGGEGSGASTAASIISTHGEEIDSVAEGLEEESTMTHEGVARRFEIGRRRKQGIHESIIRRTKSDGKVEEKKVTSMGKRVRVPEEWTQLPKAA